jgi:hypothetical protein
LSGDRFTFSPPVSDYYFTNAPHRYIDERGDYYQLQPLLSFERLGVFPIQCNAQQQFIVMNKEINLKGREVLKIQAIPGEKAYDKDSKMKDEKFLRFSYNGAVFIANTKSDFVTRFNNGTLYSADLQLTMQGDKAVLTLLNNTSVQQEVGMAKAEASINYILNSYSPDKVDASLLDELA